MIAAYVAALVAALVAYALATFAVWTLAKAASRPCPPPPEAESEEARD